MKDKFGREISYLRISVTQRCNLNCVYCGKVDCAKKEAELDPDSFYRIAKAFAACGVKKIRVHDIRHSHVSLLINMGFSALAIGERVGHEAEKITYRYAHLFPTVQTEMADRLNDARVLDTKEENSKGGKDDVEEKAG